jgi:hypothetical protein
VQKQIIGLRVSVGALDRNPGRKSSAERRTKQLCNQV